MTERPSLRGMLDVRDGQRLYGEEWGSADGVPALSLDTNTTRHLFRDIEVLRQARHVERWIVNGVSWGSTLALAYARAHPERVVGSVLFAVTTTSRREIDWITEGVGAIFPESWERFSEAS